MQDKFRRGITLSLYSLAFIVYVLIGLTAAHPYDDEVYAQHAQYFYYFLVNPGYNLPMGLYYDLINIGGYFVTILLSFGGVANVLTIQIGVKIPFILFTFLTAYFLYRIIDDMGYNGHYASLLLLTSPIYLFTSVIYGSAIVVSIFFLVASVHYLFRRKSIISAILFGISAGSYLYPLFSLPFLLRYLDNKEGKRVALTYFLVSAAFAAIGQFTVYYLYLRTGYGIISPSSPSTYLSGMPVPFYSVFDIFNLLGVSRLVPGITYDIVYYSSSLIASFSFFLLKKEKVSEESILLFFLIQGVLFSALNPYNLPSYLTAMIPFAIIFAFVKRNWFLIGLTWVASFFSFLVIETINGTGFLWYFSDLNLKILKINHSYPSWVNNISGILYSVTILSFILVVLKSKPRSASRFPKSVVSQLSVVAVLGVVSLLVLAPVISDVPTNLYLSNQENTYHAQPISEFISGHSLYVDYKVPAVGFLGKNHLGYFIGAIQMPQTTLVMYNISRNYTIPEGNFSENLALQYPLDNAVLAIFGTTLGNLIIEMKNSTTIQAINPSSSKEFGNYYIYKFDLAPTISGFYDLRVSSTVPLYTHNNSSLSIVLSGYLDTGNISTSNFKIIDGYISGNLLKTDTQIQFEGPFTVIPPSLPSLSVYLGQNLAKPTEQGVEIGAFLFLSAIILPPLLVLYSIKKAHKSGKTY